MVARQPPERDPHIGDTVQVKVLDIDRDRQRISLGLKQTQEDPWQRVVDTYNVGDELEGTVTKVVAFGAFVEILEGVEGLVHISELALHHVENPREIVAPGDEVKVKILEIDSERRRLSLSIKRVEGQVLPRAAPLARRRRPRERARAGPVRGRVRRARPEGAAEGRGEPSPRRPRLARSRPPRPRPPPRPSPPPRRPRGRGGPTRGASGRGAAEVEAARPAAEASPPAEPEAEAPAAETRGRPDENR